MAVRKGIRAHTGLLPEQVGACMFCGSGIVRNDNQTAFYEQKPMVVVRVNNEDRLCVCVKCGRDMAQRILMSVRRWKAEHGTSPYLIN